MALDFITTSRGGRKVIYNEYVYTFNGKKTSQPVGIYWKCEDQSCNARLITTGEYNIFQSSSGMHLHPPNPPSIDIRRAKHQMKQNVMANPLLPVKRTYNEIVGPQVSIYILYIWQRSMNSNSTTVHCHTIKKIASKC